jgi:hypothetical protein
MHVSIDTRLWCDPRTGACEAAEVDAATVRGPTREGCTVQVAQCRVGGELVFVLDDLLRPGLGESRRAVLTAALLQRANAIVAVVGEASTGRCSVAVFPSSPADASIAARAAAVVQASWAWDESSAILVSVGGEVIEVSPDYGASGWLANAKTLRP